MKVTVVKILEEKKRHGLYHGLYQITRREATCNVYIAMREAENKRVTKLCNKILDVIELQL